MSKNQFVFLIFVAGFLVGVISIIMLIDTQSPRTTAFVLNNQIMNLTLREIIHYTFFWTLGIICFFSAVINAPSEIQFSSSP